jgi:hypothetical protein
MLSFNFRCYQIHNCRQYDFGHTLSKLVEDNGLAYQKLYMTTVDWLLFIWLPTANTAKGRFSLA